MFLVLHFIFLGHARPRAPVAGAFRYGAHEKCSALFSEDLSGNRGNQSAHIRFREVMQPPAFARSGVPRNPGSVR